MSATRLDIDFRQFSSFAFFHLLTFAWGKFLHSFSELREARDFKLTSANALSFRRSPKISPESNELRSFEYCPLQEAKVVFRSGPPIFQFVRASELLSKL